MTHCWAKLRTALGALPATDRPLNIFFRDDDVAGDEPSLRRMIDLFRETGVPVNLEIIPGHLTEACASYLRLEKDRCPELFELNQHGWRHENHEPAGRKSEFGISRGYAEQFADIKEGKERLEEMLGSSFHPVFTPPWNRFTGETCRALEALGFKALSALRRSSTIEGYSYPEISVTLDIIDWKLTRALRPVETLIDELIGQIERRETIGIMLHHQVMDDEAFDFLGRLLEELLRFGGIEFHTFTTLLSESRYSSTPEEFYRSV